MKKLSARTFQGIALLALSIFLFERWFFGTLGWYIHERFWGLIYFAIAILFIMGLFSIWSGWQQQNHHHTSETHDHDDGHTHARFSIGALLIVMLPLTLGWVLPNRPLDSAAIGSKGINSGAPPLLAEGVTTFESAPDQRNILDWIRLFSMEDGVAKYRGEEANVTGFIYRDPRLPEGQFMLSRFVITCCAADGFALGMIVDWPGAEEFQENAWVKVKGTVDITSLDGRNEPIIWAVSVEAIEAPEQPYLFP